VRAVRSQRLGARGGGHRIEARAFREGSVDVNDYEHYRIPDAMISGG
jgi:hypothetical protein